MSAGVSGCQFCILKMWYYLSLQLTISSRIWPEKKDNKPSIWPEAIMKKLVLLWQLGLWTIWPIRVEEFTHNFLHIFFAHHQHALSWIWDRTKIACWHISYFLHLDNLVVGHIMDEKTPLLGGTVDLEEKEKVRQKYFQETSSTSSNESESASRGEFFVTMLPFIILQVVSQFISSSKFLLPFFPNSCLSFTFPRHILPRP